MDPAIPPKMSKRMAEINIPELAIHGNQRKINKFIHY
jgi:hypothetical protein